MSTAPVAPDVTDRYPTRRAGIPESMPRQDPVVWGDSEGPLTREDLAHFDQEGFVVVDPLIGVDEVESLREEVERLASPGAGIPEDRIVREPGGEDVRSVFEVHRLSSVVASFVSDLRLAGIARQLLGSEVYVHQSRVNRKPGFVGKEFSWHSDFETWHAEDGMPAARAVSISVALTPNFESNGSLMIIPGSHKTFVTTRGETPPDHYRKSLRRQEIGVPSEDALTRLADEAGRIEVITGGAGSAVVFDSNAMHGSAGNITPYPRSNLFVVYNSVDNHLLEPFAAPGRRPEFIASRDFTPVG